MKSAYLCVFNGFIQAATFAVLPLPAVTSTSPSLVSGDSSTGTSSYSLCNSTSPVYIGDSLCNTYHNNEECGYDGGDCCECTCEGDLCGALYFDCIDPSVSCVGLSSNPSPAPTTVLQTITSNRATMEPTAETIPLMTTAPTTSPSVSSLTAATTTQTFVWPWAPAFPFDPIENSRGGDLRTFPSSQPIPGLTECDAYGGNGYCDKHLNNSDCDFDKGDCCECDCSDDDYDKPFECGYNGWDDCATPDDQSCDSGSGSDGDPPNSMPTESPNAPQAPKDTAPMDGSSQATPTPVDVPFGAHNVPTVAPNRESAHVHGTLVPGGSTEVPSTTKFPTVPPVIEPTFDAQTTSTVAPTMQPTALTDLTLHGDYTIQTTRTPTSRPIPLPTPGAPDHVTAAPNRQPAEVTDTPVLGDNVAPTMTAPNRQPLEVTGLPVSGSDQGPSSLGAPTVELYVAPTAAPSAIPFEETGPTVYKGDTAPISSKSPIAQVTVMPKFHPSAVSTAAPNGVKIEDTKPPFLVHSAEPTSGVLTTQLVKQRNFVIETTTAVAAGAVALYILGYMLMLTRKRDEDSLTRMSSNGGVQEAGHTDGSSHYTSNRKPSATLTVILVSQVQYVAMWSLVDYIVEEPWLGAFCMHLRWVNLWWSASFAEDLTSVNKPRRALTKIDADGSGDIASVIAVGNIIFVFGLLLCIFLLHLFVVSMLEAHWLSKHQAMNELEVAQRCSIKADELYPRMLGAGRNGHICQHRSTVIPEVNPKTDDHTPLGKNTIFTPKKTSKKPRKAELFEGGSDIKYTTEADDDGLEYGNVVVRCPSQRAIDPIAQCRDMSWSPWVYFPHVELSFLFFAFQGVVAAQIAAVRNMQHGPLAIVASVVLVLYPVFMFTGIWRTVTIKLRNEETVLFRNFPSETDVLSDALSSGAVFSGSRGLFFRADKGRWHTAWTADETVRRERNCFRIGFEPLFVDFNESGIWFTMMFLVECTALAFVGVLVSSSVTQLFIFCSINMAAFFAVVVCRPFANKVTDGIVALVAFINGACMALMAASAQAWNGTPQAHRADIAVTSMQFVLVCVLAIPVYLDFISGITKSLRRFLTTAKNEAQPSKKINDDDIDERNYVRRFARRTWSRIWCTLLVDNLFACMRDIYRGLNRPQVRRHIAPFSASNIDPCGIHNPLRDRGVNVARTFARPFAVGANQGNGTVTMGPLSESSTDGKIMRGEVKQDRCDINNGPGKGSGDFVVTHNLNVTESVDTATLQKIGPWRGTRGQGTEKRRKLNSGVAPSGTRKRHGGNGDGYSIHVASTDEYAMESKLHTTSGTRSGLWGMESQGPFEFGLTGRQCLLEYSHPDTNSNGKMDKKDPLTMRHQRRRLVPLSNGDQQEVQQDEQDSKEGDHSKSNKGYRESEGNRNDAFECKIGEVIIEGPGWIPRSTRPIGASQPRRNMTYADDTEEADGTRIEFEQETPGRGGYKGTLSFEDWSRSIEGRVKIGSKGIRIRDPIPTDLPRRAETRSALNIKKGKVDQYTQCLHHLDNIADYKHCSSGSNSTFGRSDKTTHEPVPVDLPRRRPSLYMPSEVIDISEGTTATDEENKGGDTTIERPFTG